MGAPYYQFCPVAKAMELLDERWTMLVVRELGAGSTRFNELRRGLPRMSPSLLSRRLHQLVAAGLVERRDDGRDVEYVLTPAGEDLRPIVDALGAWGVRWITRLGEEDLDPKLLMWDLRRRVDRSEAPAGRTVVQFRFSDVVGGAREWWLVINPDEADVCDFDPGYPVAVTVSTTLRRMVEIWRGDRTWAEALKSGAVEIQGPPTMRRGVTSWFHLPAFPAPAGAA